MEPAEVFVKSEKLRAYVVAFRGLALILGLVITALAGNTDSVTVFKLPMSGGLSVVLSIGLVMYHILASFWFLKFHSNKTNLTLLIVSDCCVGLLTCAVLGSGYLLLALAVPVLEAAFGDYPWLILLIVLGIFFMVIVMIEFVGIMNIAVPQDDPEAGRMLIKDARRGLLIQSLIFFATYVISTVWAYSVSLQIEAEKVFLYKQGQEEKTLIIEDTLHDKETIQGLSNALIEKEVEIEKCRSKLAEAQEELEKNYKKYHDQKNHNAAQSELFREKENEINQLFEKRSQKMEMDVAEYKKQSEKARALLEISVELNKSLNLQEAYVSVIENFLKLIPVQTCIIFMLDTIDGRTEIFAEMVYSPYSDFFRNFSVRIGEGLPGLVAERQKTIIVDSGSIAFEGKEYQTLLNYEKSALVVPILYEEEILGVFYLGKQDNYGFNADMAEIANSFAAIAAVTLQNAQLFQKTISGGMFDDLTGLYNSIYFNERFGEEIKRSKRYKTDLSILLLDIDNFVPLNNDFGTAWGDDVLKEASEVIRAHTRETDVAARVQAGQFVVILLQSDKTNAGLIAERIRTAFEMRNMARMRRSRGTTTISIGVANFPSDAGGRDELIASVENALGRAKAVGGNNTVIADAL